VNLFRSRNCYLLPQWGCVLDEAGSVYKSTFAEAEYATPSGAKLPSVNRHSGISIAKAVVTMPYGAVHNYGHFVLDCLPTVLLFSRLEKFGDYSFVFPPLTPWQRRHLEIIGVSDRIIETAEAVVAADAVVFSDIMARSLHWQNSPSAAIRNRAHEVLHLPKAGEKTARIYLRRHDAEKRINPYDDEIADRLSALGFTALFPEKLSVDDQIKLFSSAAIVVASAGAALANTIYCRPGTIVVEIQPAPITTIWVRSCCMSADLIWRPYFARSMSAEHSSYTEDVARPEVGIRYDIDVDDLISWVQSVCPPSPVLEPALAAQSPSQ
jgi:capsular polysaccharide biosynthesis protein